MSQTFGGRQVPWEGIYATIHDVLIVSRDQRPIDVDVSDEEELPIHPGYLKATMTVLDLTTFPRRSRFLTEAKLRGCSTVAPAEVLVEQAREHVKRMVGQDIASEFLRETLTPWLNEDDG
jgi:shikimate 5-dehydrogenase